MTLPTYVDAAVDEALASRHRGVSRADARQEAYLAILEAQAQSDAVGAPEGHLDLAEVARKAVGRYVDRARRANTSGGLERIPHARLDWGWEDGLPPEDLTVVPSAEDAYLAQETEDMEATMEAALEELDPTVASWIRLVALEGRTTLEAAQEVGISKAAAQRLASAAGIREDGSPAGGQARPRRQGLVGLDARGAEPGESLTPRHRRPFRERRGRRYRD